MRLVLWGASTFGVYDIKKMNQIYWTPRQLRLKINRDPELTLEIQSQGWFSDGSKKRCLKVEEAFAIYFEDGQITVLFQKKMASFIRVSLYKDKILIGRDPFCDIVYRHPVISKKHCELYYVKDAWYFKNLSEVNGSYVNGSLVDEVLLNMGDQIFIGGIEMWYCECFLLLINPDECQLPLFIPNLNSLESKETLPTFQLQTTSSIPILNLPPFPKQSLLHVPETVLMVALMWFTSYQGSELWLGLMMMRFFISLLQVPWWKMKCLYLKRKFRIEKKAYQAFLSERYPDVFILEKKFMQLGYLLVQEEMIVRLGISSKNEVVLHSFEKAPHLVVVGEKKQVNSFIHQMVYQMMIFYPKISLGLEEMDDTLWFCEARFQVNAQQLWVGKTENKEAVYWIEPIQRYSEAVFGYDALIDLNQNIYRNHYQSEKVQFQLTDITCLFSHHYDFCRSKKQLNTPSTYFDLIGLKKEDMIVLRNKHFIEKNLIGCIGYQQDRTLYLDLNEHQDGPHLLIAGMTGSGKSEWLLSYLLSIAIYYDSLDVQFFFIDFKGGGLSQIFEKLAHTTMVMTDLEPYQIERAIYALQDEIQQRETLLLKLGRTLGLANMDINDLNHLYKQKKIEVQLPHLLIIVDEFAELKRAYPEIMQEIVRIARVGRSLGIHLILSTQRPSGVVDAQMLSNIPTKVSLKVASKQDSYDLLSKYDAANLKEAGEFYLQKQNQSTLEYGKALLVNPQENTVVLYDENLAELHRFSNKIATDDVLLEVLDQINAYSHEVPPLFYKDFIQTVEPCFGVLDDPVNRKMTPFSLAYPCLLVGASQATLQLIIEKLGYPCVFEDNREMPIDSPLILYDCLKKSVYDSSYFEDLCQKYLCIFVETSTIHLRGKLMELMKQVIYFNDEAYTKMTMKRTNLKCDDQRHIGILVNQEGSFLCQIQK